MWLGLIKTASFVWLVFMLGRKRPDDAPSSEPPPEPAGEQEPYEPPPDPTLGARWSVAAWENKRGLMPTVDEGEYQALYDRITRQLVAVVETSSYDDSGDWVTVVGVNRGGYLEYLPGRSIPKFSIRSE